VAVEVEMRASVCFLCLFFFSGVAFFVSSSACAQESRDLVTFGGDARVAPDEVVRDVVTAGGDAVIEGVAQGDVVTMGGDAVVEGIVLGDVVTMGGDLELRHGGQVRGEIVTFGGEHEGGATTVPFSPPNAIDRIGETIDDAFSGFIAYALLFVLGLLMSGLAADRFEGLRVAMVRQPVRATALGLVGVLGSVAAIIILCISVIGIPAAIALAFALPFAIWIGMAAAASVLGAMLPITALRGKPVFQLAAGCVVLYLLSLLPVVGDLGVLIAICIGLGSVLITKLRPAAEIAVENPPQGPYRTAET
jgi:hypothetical protein